MSFARPFQRPSRGPFLIVAALIVLAALLPAAAAGGPKPTHLEFRLSAPDHQDMVGEGAITLRVRCIGEPCTVVASATSKSPSLRIGVGRIKVAAGESTTLSLPLTKRQRGKLKASLEAGKSPTFTVEATAHDKGGTYIPLKIAVTAQKP